MSIRSSIAAGYNIDDYYQDIERHLLNAGPRIFDTSPINTLQISNQTITTTDIVFDLINMEDLFAIDYLKENPKNMVFKYKNNCYSIFKDDLLKSFENASNIIYKCTRYDEPPYQRLKAMVKMDQPFFKLKAIGINIGGLVLFSELKAAILDQDNTQTFEIMDPPLYAHDATASFYAIFKEFMDPTNRTHARYQNTTHCGRGTNENVYSLAKIIHIESKPSIKPSNKRKQSKPLRRDATGKVLKKAGASKKHRTKRDKYTRTKFTV
jgi:hypothetical protein